MKNFFKWLASLFNKMTEKNQPEKSEFNRTSDVPAILIPTTEFPKEVFTPIPELYEPNVVKPAVQRHPYDDLPRDHLGKIIYNGNPFSNYAEIDEYRARVDKSRNNPGRNVNYDEVGVGYPKMSLDRSSYLLREFDAAMEAGREDLAWYQITQDEKYAHQNWGHRAAWINEQVNKYNSGPTPEGWNESSIKAFRDTLRGITPQ